MKILLVSTDIDFKKSLEKNIKPIGFEVIHYTNPIKAMDNLIEVEPDLVLADGVQFPRHWKILLKLLRDEFDKEKSVFILLTDQSFDIQEAAKAIHLGANALLDHSIQNPKDLKSIENVFRRYKALQRNHLTTQGQELSDSIGFIFTHPESIQLITGQILEISEKGLSFLPDDLPCAADLSPGQIIEDCSLSLGQEILTLNCKVVHNSKNLTLTFDNLAPPLRKKLILNLRKNLSA